MKPIACVLPVVAAATLAAVAHATTTSSSSSSTLPWSTPAFARSASGSAADPVATVKAYVASHASQTFREPQGILRFPYLVPAGPYDQLWDWDSVLMGTALLSYGSRPYLAGSMMNFLDHTNATTGEVRGCLTPASPTTTIYHAKPVVIQGALIAALADGNFSQFAPFRPQMEALLEYWERERQDARTGLFEWHDQLESGCDNLVVSECPSNYSSCWVDSDADSLAAPDVMVWLAREHVAYARFLREWGLPAAGDVARAERHVQRGRQLADATNSVLWDEGLGHYVAFNTTTQRVITNRVFLMAFPLFASMANDTQAQRVVASLTQADMWSPFGVRSTASSDPRYSNTNEIVPYSNWRGPVWVNENAMLAYALNAYGFTTLAQTLANRTVATLANDILTTGTWHECYDSETGAGLAAPGFLSWDTLGATLVDNILARRNPFDLDA